MKSLKIVLASSIIVAGLVTLSSFASKSFKSNAFDVTCFYYNPPQHTGGVFFKDVESPNQDLIASEVRNVQNWITGDNPPTTPNGDCDAGTYLCAICFDVDNVTNGDDGKLTLAEVVSNGGSNLDIVFSYYNSHLNTIPHNTAIQGSLTTTVTAYRQSFTGNH
jgi:hypothetical protein